MIRLKSTDNLKIHFVLTVVIVLVGPAWPATYIVTNTSDSGSGSLRWAITQANSNDVPDRIEFNIPGTGPHTIQLASRLPTLDEEVVIDGYTQPDSEAATDTESADLKIVLDGSTSTLPWQPLLNIEVSASHCVIKGLVLNNNSPGNGINITSMVGGNVIEGNYIGTDYTGVVAKPNGNFGIWISGSPNNTIGGTTPAARNVISGNNGDGIEIVQPSATGNQVAGNFIGTDASGTSYLPNGKEGVAINNAPGNIIGGPSPGSRNVITDIGIGNPDATSNRVVGNYIGGINAIGTDLLIDLNPRHSAIHIGNASYNVIGPDNVISGALHPVIIWPGAPNNSVIYNYIGTDGTGQTSIGNGWHGVKLESSFNSIEGNVVSGFGMNGIFVQGSNEMPSQNIIANNIIGMDASGDAALPNGNGILLEMAINTTVSRNLIAMNSNNGVAIVNNHSIGNRISQNAIYDNKELGIDLILNGVTYNDEGDGDTGPNSLMNFPELLSAMATPGQLIVRGFIDTPEPKNVRLEFFANSAPDDSGFGEGEVYLGTAKPNEIGAFTAALPPVKSGMWISSTATDRDGNTSEFAKCIEATEPPPQE